AGAQCLTGRAPQLGEQGLLSGAGSRRSVRGRGGGSGRAGVAVLGVLAALAASACAGVSSPPGATVSSTARPSRAE
ncbi:hypothetical protein ACLESO_52570, partial [Pyxidicoccus sp. 3LG]